MEDKERRTRLVGKRPNRSCLSILFQICGLCRRSWEVKHQEAGGNDGGGEEVEGIRCGFERAL